MDRVNVRQARANLSRLLDRVAAGEDIVLVRRGQDAALLVSCGDTGRVLPSLAEFRQSLHVNGKPMSQEVTEARQEERY